MVSVDGGLKRQFGSICVLLPKKLFSIAFYHARPTKQTRDAQHHESGVLN